MTRETPESSSILPPTPPVAKRLNRNVLTVVAVIMFMTVLVAVVTTRTTRTPKPNPEPTPSPAATPSQPSFLDVPPHDAGGLVPADTGIGRAEPGVSGSTPSNGVNRGTPGDTAATGVETTAGVNPYALPLAQPATDLTVDSYQRALHSPVILTNRPPPNTSPLTPTLSDTMDQALLRAMLGVDGQSSPSTKSTSLTQTDASPTSHDADFLTQAAHNAQQTATPTVPVTNTPASPDQLLAGTVIPATLVTAVNSNLPGPLLAQVTHPVYDSRTQQTVIIPQGTKLLGQYDNQITSGQQRLVIAWTRMIFPDGSSITLPGVSSTDVHGAAGIAGHVDNHYRTLFGNAVLLSIISAGIQLSQPRQVNVYAPPSAGQVAGGAVGQQLGDVTTELLRKNLDIPPTISLDAGTPFNVFLVSDLIVPRRTGTTP
jgi:type IV secretory pathway VirB10-like protein